MTRHILAAIAIYALWLARRRMPCLARDQLFHPRPGSLRLATRMDAATARIPCRTCGPVQPHRHFECGSRLGKERSALDHRAIGLFGVARNWPAHRPRVAHHGFQRFIRCGRARRSLSCGCGGIARQQGKFQPTASQRVANRVLIPRNQKLDGYRT